jgi:hypothetical protein
MPESPQPNATSELFPAIGVIVETVDGHHHAITFDNTPDGRLRAVYEVIGWAQNPQLNFRLVDAARWCNRIRAMGPLGNFQNLAKYASPSHPSKDHA